MERVLKVLEDATSYFEHQFPISLTIKKTLTQFTKT